MSRIDVGLGGFMAGSMQRTGWRQLGMSLGAAASTEQMSDLHFPTERTAPAASCACPDCNSDAVALVGLEEHGPAHWWLQLRCGACGRWREAVLDDEAADRFQHDYETHVMAIEDDVAALDMARMRVEVELLTEALRRDLIDAADFGR